MKDFLSGLLDWIYKKKCYFCKSSKDSSKMCSKCFEELDYLPLKINRITEGKKVYCAGIYSKNLQKLIRGLKYHNQKDLAYFLALFMYHYWSQITDDKDFQIIPVPIYHKRKKKRKYNHMELTAIEFCKLSGYTYNPELIERVKDTKPQYKLSKPQRAENLSNAFKINKEKLLPEKILIIDDICTTGATFEEMIREFKKNGIEEADFISRQANIRLQIMEKVFAYIKENPKEKASAILIQRHFLDPDDSKKLDELLAGLDSSLSDFYVVRALRQYSEKIKRTELGAQAPDFTAKNIYGENVKLSNYSGRYLLLAFTAPWCDMCHTEDLFLDKVKQNYSKDKLDILMVSLDDDSQEVRNAVESDSIQWNIVTDSASQTMMLMDLYNVSTLPRCFLIDKEGKIILKTDNGIEIRKTLDNLSLK